MDIYKPRKPDGQKYEKWYVEITDHLRKRRKFACFKDKASSMSWGSYIEKLVWYRASRRALDSDLVEWFETIPKTLLNRLCKIGLIDSETSSATKPVMIAKGAKRKHSNHITYVVSDGHLYDFKKHLEAAERTPAHIADTVNLLAKFFKKQRISLLSEIDTVKIEKQITELRSGSTSARRANATIVAIKSFCNWLNREGRTVDNPARKIKKLNEKADRRLIRRALTEDQILKLLFATMGSEESHGLNGVERSLLYRTSLEAGLKWNEIYTLLRSDFDFVSQQPTVAVRAENEKAGRGETLPLPISLAQDLEGYFASNPTLPHSRAFVNMHKTKGAEMLRQDLDSAGINWRKNKAKEVLDFHSLRHTYGTRFAKSGVMPAQLQRLMRHSDINLTMRYYTHLSLNHLGEEIKKLPNFSMDVKTNSAVLDNSIEMNDLMKLEVDITNNVESNGDLCGVNIPKYTHISQIEINSNVVSTDNKKIGNAFISSTSDSLSLAPPAGLEPATHGLTVHCSTN